MATLSSSTGSLHRDVRSDALSYKRDKEHSTKWAMGTRPSYGVKARFDRYGDEECYTGSPEQQAKVRPEKRYYDSHKQRGNGLSKLRCSESHAFGRLTRKVDNILEVRSAGPSLSQSLGDLSSAIPADFRNPPPDAGVLYSFDAPAAPRKSIGLDGLIEKAERDFMSRETDKIVRNEYEILDERGEVKVMTKGKGKKGSPRQRAKVEAANEDEDDWEQI